MEAVYLSKCCANCQISLLHFLLQFFCLIHPKIINLGFIASAYLKMCGNNEFVSHMITLYVTQATYVKLRHIRFGRLTYVGLDSGMIPFSNFFRNFGNMATYGLMEVKRNGARCGFLL